MRWREILRRVASSSRSTRHQMIGRWRVAPGLGQRTRSPVEILSPREREVLGLLAEGMRNKDIAGALFISQSTTKVHVRNVSRSSAFGIELKQSRV